MSKLTREDVIKIAKLSRLSLTDEEIDRSVVEIGAILEYVEVLQQVDTEGLEPTYQVTSLQNVMRPDEILDYGTTPNVLLKNAPQTEADHFKVKRMIG